MLVGVCLIGMSVAPAAMGAAPVVDTEQTDTSTTSEITGSTVIDPFTANSSKTSALEFETDSTNPEVWVRDDATGEVISVVSTSSMNQTYANDTESKYYYQYEFSHDEFQTISGETGENSTVTLEIYNDTTVDNPDVTNVSLQLAQSDRTVVRAGPQAVADGDLEITDTFEVAGFTPLGEPEGTFDTTTTVPSSNGTLVVAGVNNTLTTRLSDAAGSESAGGWIQSTALTVDGNAVQVYLDEAPDGVDSTDTYAVYDSGDSLIEVYPGDDIADVSNADVSVRANTGLLGTLRVYGMDFGTISSLINPLFMGTGLFNGLIGLMGVGMVAGGRRDLRVRDRGQVSSWGITMAVHRLGVGIWTFFTANILGTVITIIALVVAIVHLIATAIPRVDGDMFTFGIDVGGWVAELFAWTGKNFEYLVDGDNRWSMFPNIP